MARINKSALTKLEIIQAASRQFLENGYTATSAKSICNDLDMSTGNLTFYFPTKEHLLTTLVELFCEFQWKLMEEETHEGYSSIMAICLELAAMAVMCEEDPVAKDFFLSAYSSPLSLAVIRRNDTDRAKAIFGKYRPEWTDVDFVEAEVLISGVEYATFMTAGEDIPLAVRISGALETILSVFAVPEDIRQTKINKVLGMDYRSVGRRALKEFKAYVEEANEQALLDLLRS